jgi:hypothetical protein
MLEMKVALAHFVSRYTVVPDPAFPLKTSEDVTLHPNDKGVRVFLTRRSSRLAKK